MSNNENLNAPASPADDAKNRLKLLGFFLFPLALFPFLALASYRWESVASLKFPAEPTRNLIGVAGDCFAYGGYRLIGLAIWFVPPLCVLLGMLFVLGKTPRFGRRFAAFLLFMFAVTCLLQLLGGLPVVAAALDDLNIAPNAGGAVGYLVMDCAVAKLLSPFGASILTALLAAFALLMMVGVRTLLVAVGNFLGGGKPLSPEEAAERERVAREKEDQIRAAQLAREEAKKARLAEKQRIAAEKAAAKAARRAERDEDVMGGDLFATEPAAVPRPAPRPNPFAPAADAPVAAKPSRASAPKAAPAPKPAPAPADQADPAANAPYELPPLSLLDPPAQSQAEHGDVDGVATALVATLARFGVETELVGMVTGPVVTQYKLLPAPNVKVERIPAYSGNLQMTLKAKSLRIQAPIPGEDCVGIEVPNPTPGGVAFGDLARSASWQKAVQKYYVPLLLGKDAAGNDLLADLSTMPHMLIAGATGQGKSVCLNSIINGFLMSRTPEQLKLIMVDPKRVEFTSYGSLPHLLVPIVNDTNKVVFALKWAVVEMDKRLKMFSRCKCRNIVDFNTRKTVAQPDLFGGEETVTDPDTPKTIPYIVIIIDEVADIMQTNRKEVEPVIARLTALARATGIHLILATQRPDAKIITGVIKSNIPGRIAFKTSSSIDARTILDETGSENLIGRGDMLFKTKEGALIRAQGSYISDPEIGRITTFISDHASVQFDEAFAAKLAKIKESDAADALEENGDGDGGAEPAGGARPQGGSGDDEQEKKFRDALEVVRVHRRASTSFLQRKMGIGYNHASRLIELMEERGIVGPAHGAGPREILVDLDAYLDGGAGDAPDGAASAADGDTLFTETETENDHVTGIDAEIGA